MSICGLKKSMNNHLGIGQEKQSLWIVVERYENLRQFFLTDWCDCWWIVLSISLYLLRIWINNTQSYNYEHLSNNNKKKKQYNGLKGKHLSFFLTKKQAWVSIYIKASITTEAMTTESRNCHTINFRIGRGKQIKNYFLILIPGSWDLDLTEAPTI